MTSLEFRSRIILSIITTVLLLMIFALIHKYGLLGGGVYEESRREELIAKYKMENVIEGTIVDRNGDILMEAQEPGVSGKLVYPEETSIILGYRSKIYGSSGLRQKYSRYLLDGDKDNVGSTIKLTIDKSLQNICYELLGPQTGSIIVMDNDTGELLAMASRNEKSEFDANVIDTEYNRYASIDEFLLNRAILAQDAPGSTFKIVTAAAILQVGDEFIYDDTTGMYLDIHNAGNVAYGPNLTMEDAMKYSCNTYFAAGATRIDGQTLKKTIDAFQYNSTIECDFGVINSSVDLQNYGKSLVAQTGFGQGGIKCSPMNILLMMEGIINDGKIHKPYLIFQIYNKEKEYLKGTSEVLANNIVSKETSDELKRILLLTGEYYGLKDTYAKTGTAQTNVKDLNHIYLVFGNRKITSIISIDRTKETSGSLIPIAKKILEYTNDFFGEEE